MTAITISDLTQAATGGNGVFDTLMRAARAHLDEEFGRGRIKGPEYADVYLGGLNQVLSISLQFLLNQQKTDLEAQLLQKQIEAQTAQILQIQAQTDLLEQQRLNALTENATMLLQQDKLSVDIALVNQQLLNLQSEKLQTEQQTTNLVTENATMLLQQTKLTADTNLVNQQKLLAQQQTTNAVTENTVLIAQECKLRAEYDLTMEQKLRTVSETALIEQKKTTEKAQTVEMGVDENSVIGRQKGLYQAQITGFGQDATHKAVKLLVDTWNVRRTTDSATVADSTNKLDDATIGQAINGLLSSVGL